jgi:DNA-binding MarR family transcriptional regulator
MSRLPKEITTTLLLTIFSRGEVTMTQLQKETGFSTITVLNHVEELMTADLVEERRETELPKRRFLRLSKQGLKVASTLNLLTVANLDSRVLIDLGAKAGRMAAYREAATLLRQQNVTRDSATAEFLVRDLELLVEALIMVADALPSDLEADRKTLKSIKGKLEPRAIEARGYLQKNDLRRCGETVASAWKEYGMNREGIGQLLKELKAKKLDELSKITEFISPGYTQKD